MSKIFSFRSLQKIIMASLSCLADEERTARLQQRTKEAESAVKQLRACIDVIKQRSREGDGKEELSAQAQEFMKENEQLCIEVDHLKQKLINLELMNGVDQVPLPRATVPFQIHQPPCPQVDSDPPQEKTSVSVPLESSNGGKSDGEKSSGGDKKGSGGGAKQEKGKSKKQPAVAQSSAAAAIDVSRLDFRIGLITTASKHPEADTLYVEEIDIGEGTPRTVCSGLVKQIPLEQMQNRPVVMLCNLKPAKMRGVVSAAMVMCASSGDKTEIIDPPAGAVPGERVVFEGYTGTPDAQLNPKKKIFEQVQPDLRTNDDCVACYRNIPFTVPGKGICTVPSLKNCIIK